MFRIRNWLYKAFLGDNEREVHWHAIPVHFWSIQTSQRMVQAQDNDGGLTTTAINKEQHLVSKHTISMRHEELLSTNSHDSILYRMLKLQGLSRAYRRLMMRKVGALARSMTMPNVKPIFVIISEVITYMRRRIMERMIEEVDNEGHVTTIRISMEEEVIKIVPTAKSSIDKLEKVKMKLDDQCSICLEEFENRLEEVTRMPCSHVYHAHCIVKWLEYNRLCPLCRFEMPKSID